MEILGSNASTITNFGDNNYLGAGVSFRKGYYGTFAIVQHSYIYDPSQFFPSFIGDIHLTGGKIWHRKFLTYGGGLGVSYIVTIRDTRESALGFGNVVPEYKPKQGIGLPLEGRLYFTPFRWFGIGILPYANINSVKSYAGTMYGIIIGNIKTRRKP